MIDSDQMPVVAIGLGGGNQLPAITLSEAVLPPPQLLAALWLDFEGDDYWADGTDYANLASVPGYTFTRSGQQGALDSDGTVDWFAADVPAINGAGYHAYGALTNYLLNSQDLTAWTALADGVGTGSAPVATANQEVAPDGTTTADLVVLSARSATTRRQLVYSLNQGLIGAGTASIWAKAKAAGDVGKSVAILTWNGTSTVETPYVLAADWQRLPVYRADHNTASSGNVGIGRHDVTPGLDAVEFYAWQGQLIPGNFPDGGPIIATAGATASIGASALAVTLANGTYDATYNFDDDTTQNAPALAIADGALNLPTDFAPNRNIIKLLTVE